MKWLTALLAVALFFGAVTAAPEEALQSPGVVRYATAAEWAACIRQTQAELAPRGQCGASNCYDDAGRDLIDICVAKVGYLRYTSAETAALLREISEGDISNATVSKVRTYPPGHPVRKAFAKAQARR
jgi:hypothetical protein